jgi:hypothetical protein
MMLRRRVPSAARIVTCAALISIVSLWTVTQASAVTLTDNFDDVQDYTVGPGGAGPNEPWTGMWNLPLVNGSGVFDSSTSNPGTLTVEDNGTVEFDEDPGAGTGPGGQGWEGGRSTSPMLYTDVPAGQDFTATVKISSQTSGFWSTAGIIARAANSPTDPGVQADNADENFTTAYSFRTDAANNAEGNTLQKRIENGAQLNDNNFVINAAGTEPFPILVRMERVGGGFTYREWVSTDNGATWQFQSRVRPTAGNPLRDPAVGMQVGLSHMMFGGTFNHDNDPMTPEIPRPGTAQFDDFVLDYYDPLPAPGAPVIPSSFSITVPRNHDIIIQQLISDSSGQGGPLQWTIVNDPANPAAPAPPPATITTIRQARQLLPGATTPGISQGGQPAVLDAVGDPNPSFPGLDSTIFRWNTQVNQNMNTAAGQNPLLLPEQPWNPGVYKWTVRATNDWGQVSNDMLITVRLLIPEPSTIALGSVVCLAMIGWMRRRR